MEHEAFIDLTETPESSTNQSSLSDFHAFFREFSEPQHHLIRDNDLLLQTMESLCNSSGPESSRRKKNLSDEERQAIFEFILKESNDGKIKYGSASRAARLFSVSRSTVERIWCEAKGKLNDGIVQIKSKQIGRVDRKRIQCDISRLPLVPLWQWTNIRSLANALGLSKSAVHRLIKEGSIRAHTNSVKPFLTDENKRARLEFCISMLDPVLLSAGTPYFKNMMNVVHIDEKWFHMSKTSTRYYVLPEETEPVHTCKSKRFICKVMFLAAVARPRFDLLGNCEFSGKIGIFPFIFKEPAKRNSKNRRAGTLETKPIQSVGKEVMKACLIEKVLPAIRKKWPMNISGPIFIQQDNATPHISPNDIEYVEAAKRDGFDIQLLFQTPNSPDMNVLDLGFFRAIQSLQHQKALKNIDELVEAVETSYEEISPHCLNHVFLSLQSCMIEVMKVHGGNNYKLPHMGKKALEKTNSIPCQIACDHALVEECLKFLNQ